MSHQHAHVKLTADLTAFRQSMARGIQAAAKLAVRFEALQRAAHTTVVAGLPPRDRRRHRARCDWCNPYSNPKPMPALHGYQRRRKARARRRR